MIGRASYAGVLHRSGLARVLDGLSIAPTIAIGVRQLLTSHAGPVLRLRRSSDNQEQDFGYTGLGLVDTAGMLAFCGAGGSGWLSKWYNPATPGSDFAQTTASRQPRLVNNGTIQSLGDNPQPGVRFNGTMKMVYPATLSGAVSVIATAARANAGTAADTIDLVLMTKADGSSAGLEFNLGNGFGGAADNTKARAGGTGVTVSAWLNGAKFASASPFSTGTGISQAATFGFTASGVQAAQNATIGGATNADKYFLNGNIGSLVVVPGILSDAEMARLTSAIF